MNQSNNTCQKSELAEVKLAEESKLMLVGQTESSAVVQRKTNLKDWSGIQQGKIKVISLHSSGTHKTPARWNCKCDCGTFKIICSSSLRAGTISCGCLRIDKIKSRSIHNKCNTNTYRSWKAMIQRCSNKNNHKYPRYGARGISVCDKWKTFAGFLDDMGECPSGYQIDRIDNDGNYNKANCRWANVITQARNKSNNKMIEINKETKTMAEWCEIHNVSSVMVRMRIHRGMNPVEALTKEPRKWH